MAIARPTAKRRRGGSDSARQSVNKVHDRRGRDGRSASALTGQRHGTLTFRQCGGSIFPRSFSILRRPEIADLRELPSFPRHGSVDRPMIDGSRLKVTSREAVVSQISRRPPRSGTIFASGNLGDRSSRHSQDSR